MSQLIDNLEISFEEFLRELPENFHDLAREFKAFARGRKIDSTAMLLQVIMSLWGVFEKRMDYIPSPEDSILRMNGFNNCEKPQISITI